MTKNDLIQLLSHDADVTKDTASRVLESFMKQIPKALKSGERVELRGFGIFSIKQCAEKIARNIGKGTQIVIPAHKKLSFKFCKELQKV